MVLQDCPLTKSPIEYRTSRCEWASQEYGKGSSYRYQHMPHTLLEVEDLH